MLSDRKMISAILLTQFTMTGFQFAPT